MPQPTRNVPSDVALEVFEGLPEGVVVFDRKWRYTYVNPCGAELLGTTVDALLGKAYLDVYPEARGSAFQLGYERVLATGQSEVIEDYYKPFDKTFRSRVMRWSDGVVIFYTDVSEQRRREAALVGELDVLQQVVRHADAAVALLDLDHRCLLVNAAVGRFLAKEPEALTGRLVTELLPTDFGEQMVRLLEVIRRTRAAESFEQSVQLAPGQPERDLSVVLFPTYDVAGELAGMGVIATDITHWRAAERAVAASDHRFQVMFRHTSLGQVLFEVGACVVDANDAFCELLGYTLPELRTMTAAQVIVDGTSVAALHRRLRGEGVVGYEQEDELLRKDGTHVPVLRSVSLFDDPVTGRPMAATIVRDLSAYRELQRTRRAAEVHRAELLGRLVQAQELERARIAADIHDDSVQAVAAADLRIGLLRRQVSLAAPEFLPLADKAQQSVAGAAERLRQLLFDLESPDPGLALRPALVQLASHVLEDSALRWSVVGDDIDLAYAERVTALRIAKEALLNVRKHANAAQVTLAVHALEGGVVLTVADDGVAPDAATISSPEGHRGLATMRDRAEIAGGWWRLDNAEGGGLQVRTWLPGGRPPEQG